MSYLKKCVLANPPKTPKMKSLDEIYAAEDARKAASNSPPKIPEESSSTASNTEPEALDFEEISSSFASKENDLKTSEWVALEVSLKDLRARCNATKKRKADPRPKEEAGDLDEPLIVLKAKRPKASRTMRSESMVVNVISEHSIDRGVQGLKGLAEEDPQGSQETLSVQTDFNATSSSSDVTSPGNEPLLEVEPIDIALSMVNFIAKFDSSCDPSSNTIWPMSGNIQSRKNLMFSFNKACTDIVESEENFYSPENRQNNLPENEIIDVEVGSSPVAFIGNAPDIKWLTGSFNEACIDAQSEENLCSPEKSQDNLYDDRITEVEGDASPATITEKLPTGENLICSFKEACTNDVESGENFCTPESSQKNSLESEFMELQDVASAAKNENMQDGNDLISSCNETCIGDMESGGNLYSPESSQKDLHGSEIAEAESHASPITANSLDGDNIRASFNVACIKNVKYEENFYLPKSGQNNSQETESAEVQAGESAVKVTQGAIVDALVNKHKENGSNDNHGFLCEGAPGYLGSSNCRSSEGQLESIVYSAISTSKCLYKKEDDPSTSVHSTLGSLTENSETYSNYRNGVVANFGEVCEGSNQVHFMDILKTETTGVLQLCDNLNKEQSTIDDNGGAELENGVKGDPRTIRERAPIKLLSNRTIISPTSQEKLCQGLTGIDLCEGAEIPKCKKKILYENCTGMKKCAMTTQSTERSSQKPGGVIKKGNLKSTGVACKKDPSVKMDTEKTIEFLRRQMHDFENVTTKLLKNMRFVKSVLDETLAVQSPLPSKFSAEEIKAASENASQLERTTNRWLALMSKDCNRFCKILRSADNVASSPPTSNNGVQNRKRKITFADEAGKALCHIRVFSEPSSPPAIAETEKSDQLK